MSELEELLRQATAGAIPGVSLATIRAGAPGPAHFFGKRGPHDASSVDAGTVFEAASLTKPLVAFIALQLVDEGVLDLDAPLHGLCGEYVPDDERSRLVTSRHVLTHTSGLPNIVREDAPLKTHFAPGERFSYGSSAFAWLQRAMQTLTGRSLEQLARQRIFGPLGMSHSSLANSARGLRLAHSVLPLTVQGEHPSVQWMRIGAL